MTDERNKEFEFKVGDKVKVPFSSQVLEVKSSGKSFPATYNTLKVVLDNGDEYFFTAQGR